MIKRKIRNKNNRTFKKKLKYGYVNKCVRGHTDESKRIQKIIDVLRKERLSEPNNEPAKK